MATMFPSSTRKHQKTIFQNSLYPHRVAVVCVPVQTYAAIHVCTGIGTRGKGVSPPPPFLPFSYIYTYRTCNIDFDKGGGGLTLVDSFTVGRN